MTRHRSWRGSANITRGADADGGESGAAVCTAIAIAIASTDGENSSNGKSNDHGRTLRNFNSSALSYQSQSSTMSSMHSNSKDIEEEAKHKLLAFLSKPDGLNWEDLVRSLASEKMEKKSKKSGRSRARSPSPEPQAASMLNKVITVISHSGSTVYDDDISEMESDENVERFSKRERKKRDRLESMIEGVVMGKIAVDVGCR